MVLKICILSDDYYEMVAKDYYEKFAKNHGRKNIFRDSPSNIY